MLVPASQTIMAEAAGPKRIARIIGSIGVPMMIAPIFGPVAGGLILGFASWRWIFLVNIPIGLVAVVLAWRVLPSSARRPTGRFDFGGLALISVGLPLLLYGLTEFGLHGSRRERGRARAGGARGSAVARLCRARAARAGVPLLDLSLYRNHRYAWCSLAILILSAAGLGSMILLPLYYQDVRGDGVLAAGLLIAPQSFGAAAATPAVGRLMSRHGAGVLTTIGIVVMGLATIPLCLISAHTPIALIISTLVFRGIGSGSSSPRLAVAVYQILRLHEIADGATQTNIVMRVGGSTWNHGAGRRAPARARHARLRRRGGRGFRVAFWSALGLDAAGAAGLVGLAAR